jgi:hypothetical protein
MRDLSLSGGRNSAIIMRSVTKSYINLCFVKVIILLETFHSFCHLAFVSVLLMTLNFIIVNPHLCSLWAGRWWIWMLISGKP